MFMEGGSVQDLERILQVRGNKKGDFSGLVKSIESKNIWSVVVRNIALLLIKHFRY